MPRFRAAAWIPVAVGDIGIHDQRIEESIAREREPPGSQRRGQSGGAAVHLLGDGADALGAVVDRVHAGHHRQQHLCVQTLLVAFSRRMCCSRV
jgi:hypothetical protein